MKVTNLTNSPYEVPLADGTRAIVGAFSSVGNLEPEETFLIYAPDSGFWLIEQDDPEPKKSPKKTKLVVAPDEPTGKGEDPAADLLVRAKLALSPGPTFGPQGTGFARLNFGTSPALLTEAVERIARLYN